jgi:hypothetical protein
MPVNSESEACLSTESAKFLRCGQLRRKFSNSSPVQGPLGLYLGIWNFSFKFFDPLVDSSSSSDEEPEEESESSELVSVS